MEESMIGQYAFSKAGHDKGTLYMIAAEEGDFVYLTDGRLKSPEQPKKKRRKHIQPVNSFAGEALRKRMESGVIVRPEEIRYAIKQFEANEVSIKVEEMYVKE